MSRGVGDKKGAGDEALKKSEGLFMVAPKCLEMDGIWNGEIASGCSGSRT